MSHDPRLAVLARLKKLQNPTGNPDAQTILFGEKMKGKTYAEGYQDKDWMKKLASRTTPMTAAQKDFLTYVEGRLCEDEWATVEPDTDSIQKSSGQQLTQSTGNAEGVEPTVEMRLKLLEKQVEHMTSLFEGLTACPK